MDTELIMAIAGIALAFVGLAVLAVLQQTRIKREKQEKAQAMKSATAMAPDAVAGRTPFFVARYRGNKARFFRVYSGANELLFLYAGPFIIMIDPETVRGTDRRHWLAQSARLLRAGLAVGGVAAIAAVAVIVRGIARNAGSNPEAAGDILLGVLGIAGLLAVGLILVLPAVVWRIMRRGAELDALSLAGLREQAATHDWSFRATADNLSDVRFNYLDPPTNSGQTEIGAILSLHHKPTGKWRIETTTTRDTNAAIAAFREVLGSEAVEVELGLEGRLSGKLPIVSSAVGKAAVKVEKLPGGYGFPLAMLAGFSVGAIIAIAAAFVLSSGPGGRFTYVGTLKLLFSLGGLGTFLAHEIAAWAKPERGLRPLGPVPMGALALGGVIVLGGSAAILQVLWWIIGPP